MSRKMVTSVPETHVIEAELRRVQYKKRYKRALRATIYFFIVVAAIAVLVAKIWLPVLRIYGSSMTPAFHEGEIVIAAKGSSFSTGDIVALYVGNKLLVKRVAAGPGQWVDISRTGDVYVDGRLVDEPYIEDRSYGEVSIRLPYQVPDSRYFVLGDHRSTSSDSRNAAIGCISEEQIVGKVVFRVWPLDKFGTVANHGKD